MESVICICIPPKGELKLVEPSIQLQALCYVSISFAHLETFLSVLCQIVKASSECMRTTVNIRYCLRFSFAFFFSRIVLFLNW